MIPEAKLVAGSSLTKRNNLMKEGVSRFLDPELPSKFIIWGYMDSRLE
jgi:hypothetical protein